MELPFHLCSGPSDLPLFHKPGAKVYLLIFISKCDQLKHANGYNRLMQPHLLVSERRMNSGGREYAEADSSQTIPVCACHQPSGGPLVGSWPRKYNHDGSLMVLQII